jgi:AraC-like DNA-binding protein
MLHSRVRSFADPDRFQAEFRAGNYEMLGPSNDRFHAELTRIDFTRLGMQRSDRIGPSVVRSMSDARRVPVMFLVDADQEAPRRNGMELSAQDIAVHRPGSTNHLQTQGASRLAMMSLATDDLAAETLAITGREIAPPRLTYLARPAPALLDRLRTLHGLACTLAKADPDALSRPETAKALEHDLIHAMVACLADHQSDGATRNGGSHGRVMARFEDFLAAKQLEPVYLAEICSIVGASERTLRTCCQEHLGMGPIRYLWLRRMNLAHRALVRADPTLRTVTEIVTEHGFWELGRFSVEYRALFGKSPSTSLRRPAGAIEENIRLESIVSDFA